MDKDLRASLIAAIAATTLSALIGIFARVGFLTLLFRALVCGLLIGAAVYGAIFLMRKMMPEILEGLPSGDAAEGDYDASAAAIGESGQPAASGAAPDGALSGDSQIGANIDIVLPGDEEGTEVEMLEPSPEAFAQAASSPAGASDVEDAEDASLLEPEAGYGEAAMPVNAYAQPKASVSSERRSPQSGGFDELDVLPDLDGFTDSFTASEFASGGSSGAASGDRSERMPSVPSSGSARSSSRSGQEGADPAALAQAVRTILKRDQKG